MSDWLTTQREKQIEKNTYTWFKDWIGDAPFWDTPFDNFWSEKKHEHGANFSVVIPIAYMVENMEVMDWLEDNAFPNLFRGDNGASEVLRSDMETYLESIGSQIQCKLVRYQRHPASIGDEIEFVVVTFHFVVPQ